MRVALVRERLLECSPEEAVAWLAVALDRTPTPTPGADALHDALVEVLTHPGDAPEDAPTLPYDLRRDLYEASVTAGSDRLSAMLRSHPTAEDEEAVARRLPRDVADIPLGRRRSLARGDDPYLLEKLALDPDPAVIANLLRNPRTREADVVRIAALRPVAASTLEEVARSPRFGRQPRVRVAIVRNPHCPVALAVRLIGSVPLGDLRAMRGDPDLPPETRAHVLSELERRTD